MKSSRLLCVDVHAMYVNRIALCETKLRALDTTASPKQGVAASGCDIPRPPQNGSAFFEHMYSDLRNKRGDERDASLTDAVVLVPKNDMANRVNDHLLDTLLDGEQHVYVAINTVPDKAQTPRSIRPASRRVAFLLM